MFELITVEFQFSFAQNMLRRFGAVCRHSMLLRKCFQTLDLSTAAVPEVTAGTIKLDSALDPDSVTDRERIYFETWLKNLDARALFGQAASVSAPVSLPSPEYCEDIMQRSIKLMGRNSREENARLLSDLEMEIGAGHFRSVHLGTAIEFCETFLRHFLPSSHATDEKETLMKVLRILYVSAMSSPTRHLLRSALDRSATVLLEPSDSEFLFLALCASRNRLITARFALWMERQFLVKWSRLDSVGIALVGLAFFKTQHRFKSHRPSEIMMQTLLGEVGAKTGDLVNNALAKVCKMQDSMEFVFSLKKLMTALRKSDPDSVSVMVWLNAIAICNNYKYYCHEFLSAFERKFLRDLDKMRIKDIAKPFPYLSNINFVPANKNFYDKVLKEVRSEEHLRASQCHPNSIIEMLARLALVGKFPEDLISHVLSEEFGENILKYLEWSNWLACDQLYFLDCAVALNCPSYSGPRLSDKMLRLVQAQLPNQRSMGRTSSAQLTFKNKFLFNLCKVLIEGVKTPRNCVAIGPLLPHFYPACDILIRLVNGNPEPITINGNIRRISPKDLQVPSGEKRMVFTVFTGTDYKFRSSELLWPPKARVGQLKKLGYQVVPIEYATWQRSRNHVEFLRRHIQGAVTGMAIGIHI